MNQSGEIIVNARQLGRMAGNKILLGSITAQVCAGDVIALLGKNGAGKTTLLDTLLGFLLPSAGEVHLWGRPAPAIGALEKANIGYVPQQDELMPQLTGAEHLTLFRNFRTRWNQALVEKLTFNWLIPLEIPTRKMSVGQRQKLSILLALAHEPQLLVLDEPVASLDPIARRQFLQELVTILEDDSRAIIFSTHIVSDAERLANKVWFLRDGILAYHGEMDCLKENFVRFSLPLQHPQLADLLVSRDLVRTIEHGNQAVVTLNSGEESAPVVALLQKQGLVMEHLGLEDIFMEMNL